MNKILTVEIKNVYGEERIYPICEGAKTFARLCKTTTLTSHAIHTIKELGYTFKQLEKEI